MMDTIGFLGCGNMGGAIARAVCKAVDPKKVFLANRTAAKAQALAKELGCKTATNAEVAGDCDLIFLAVKPQMMEALLEPLRFTLDERPKRFVLCSMAAGLSIARIQELAGEDFPVIRIMPNTPASVGEGMIQYCSSNVTAEEEEAFLKQADVVVAAYDPSWAPLEYTDTETGMFSGVTSDLLSTFSRYTGLRFHFEPIDQVEPALDGFESSRIIIQPFEHLAQFAADLVEIVGDRLHTLTER